MPEYKEYIESGKLELHVTGDLLDGDYTEAIIGASAVVHVASPVEFGDKEFTNSHLAPAVQGTRGVLNAAAKEASVKAVVMTSTIGKSFSWKPHQKLIIIGAVGDYRYMPWDQIGVTFTEESWNPHTKEDMEKIVSGGAGQRVNITFKKLTLADNIEEPFPMATCST
jgi:nucleoside-diphosphate-sugar epimerase